MEMLTARVDLDEIRSLAQIMIDSRMFSDIQSVAQGAVRILAGRELGIGPVAALRSIDVVRGNLSIRSHMMAAMIKRSTRYNYRVTVSTDDKCAIDFMEDGEVSGTSEFTMADAKHANLLVNSSGKANEAWQRYPKTMLYNRAMSQGARMYCPDIFLGGVFYESEIVEAEAMDITRKPAPESVAQSPEPEPFLEPASDRQQSYLLALLKDGGVLEGDKRKLLDFAYSDYLSKQTATELIEIIKEQKTLPDSLRKAYVKMLVQDHGHDRHDVAAHMDKSYGHHDPAKLNNAQFTLFVEHLAGTGQVDTEEEPDDIYLPGKLVSEPQKDVTVQDWVEFTKNVCTTCQISARQFEEWVLSQFGNGTAEEITQLPKEVYHSLTAMDIDSIKSQVTAYHSVDDTQGVLVT